MDVIPINIEVQILTKLQVKKTDDKSKKEEMKPSMCIPVAPGEKVDQENDRGIDQEIVQDKLMDINAFNFQKQEI